MVFEFRCYVFGVLWYSVAPESSTADFLYCSPERSFLCSHKNLTRSVLEGTSMSCVLGLWILGRVKLCPIKRYPRDRSRQIQMRQRCTFSTLLIFRKEIFWLITTVLVATSTHWASFNDVRLYSRRPPHDGKLLSISITFFSRVEIAAFVTVWCLSGSYRFVPLRSSL